MIHRLLKNPPRALLSQTEGRIISCVQENRNEQWECITARTLLPSRGNLLNKDFFSKQAFLEETRAKRSLLKRSTSVTWQTSSPWHMAAFPLIPLTTHFVQSGSRTHLFYTLGLGRQSLKPRAGEGRRGPGPSEQPWKPWAYIPSRPLWWL